MLRRLFLTALLAGLAAGLAVSAVQWARVLPLIAAAERYEVAPAGGAPAAAAEPAPDSLRHLRTLAANGLAGVGFGLLLAAGLALSPWPVSARSGLLWGAAGFAVFALAPALGLPPVLPGAHEAPLRARQLWWGATVAASALGLGLVAFQARPPLQALGVAAALLPHLVGPPRPDGPGATALPEALAREFVAASLSATAAFWLVLGAVAGYVWSRLR